MLNAVRSSTSPFTDAWHLQFRIGLSLAASGFLRESLQKGNRSFRRLLPAATYGIIGAQTHEALALLYLGLPDCLFLDPRVLAPLQVANYCLATITISVGAWPPSANGDPESAVSIPVFASTEYAEIVLSTLFTAKRKLPLGSSASPNGC